MFVSLGSACRPGYQIKSYYKRLGIKPNAFPFDWTITPFYSIKCIMGKRFDVNRVLKCENLVINEVGSLTDSFTGLLHHHDFHPKDVKRFFGDGFDFSQDLPVESNFYEFISNAKGRFEYAFENLNNLKDKSGKTVFIRWQRRGHPDKQFPSLFHNETPDTLCKELKGFLGHSDFLVICIETWEVAHELSDEQIIHRYEGSDNYRFSVIKERKGFDGDGTNDYRGDTYSWSFLFDYIIRVEGLGVDASWSI